MKLFVVYTTRRRRRRRRRVFSIECKMGRLSSLLHSFFFNND